MPPTAASPPVAVFPPCPLESWEATKHTFHLYLQIVGKVRLAMMPKRNHWWHVPLYVSARGLTTGPMPDENRLVTIDLDLVDHRVIVACSDGTQRSFPLHEGRSVASFYTNLTGALDALGVEIEIANPEPFDHPDSTIPFAEDETHATYDADAVHRFWRILTQIQPVFQAFRGTFLGKDTPVHLFWHSFDLAYTRFSGRRAPVREEAGRVEREAYSHEVISFGFWAGDDNVREPAFYAYVHPEPEGLTDRPLRPTGAEWLQQEGGALAVYRYADARSTAHPHRAIRAFLESAYAAGTDAVDLNVWADLTAASADAKP